MIVIDGSIGEGGGQILRSALALSMVTGRPFRIEKIRAGRPTPGLLRQHLTAVNAAAEICGAEVEGAAVGSLDVTFIPHAIRSGDYSFAVGTAGSTTLVFQTILPALMCAPGPSRVCLEGGTHNPFAPPFEFLQKSFLPLLARMGPQVDVVLERAGFYPAGGGRMIARIEPATLKPLHLLERGQILHRRSVAAVANLPLEIAERESGLIGRELCLANDSLAVVSLPGGPGPGNVITLELESEHVSAVFTGFGQRGVRAEAVVAEIVGQVRQYLEAGVPVCPHLADQLMLPLALAGGGSFATMPLSRHASTNIEVIGRFVEVPIRARLESGRWIVSV